MTHNRDHFESFDDHTRLKHAILKSYLIRWAAILLGRHGGRCSRVVFVDGFAGSGEDQQGNPGSPRIARDVAETVRRDAETMQLVTGARVCVGAIEAKLDHFRSMESLLATAAAEAPTDFRLRYGAFSDHVGEMVEWAGSDPTLWFLDPFGVKGLDARWYADMLRGPKNEMFVLAAHTGAVRITGSYQAAVDSIDKDLALREAHLSLFPDEDAAYQQRLTEERHAQQQALEVEDPETREILRRALGDEARVRRIELASRDNRAAVYVECFCEALRDAGVLSILSLPIRDRRLQPKHVLIHAAKSEAATRAMKKAVTEGLRRPDISETVRQLLKLELRVSIDGVIDDIAQRFRGQTLPWSNANAGVPVSEHILSRSSVFDFQLEEIKQRLRERGWLTRDRIEIVVFP